MIRLSAFLIGFALLSVAACGFQPLYQQASPNRAGPLNDVVIEPITDRLGQLIRNELLAYVGVQVIAPSYKLIVNVAETVDQQSVTQDNEVTLAYVVVRGDYQLLRLSDNQIMASGQLQSQTSFDLVESPYAEITGLRIAREMLARDFAQHLVTRISVVLKRGNRQ